MHIKLVQKLCLGLLLATSQLAVAMDIEMFSKLAKDTINQVNTGVVGDIDALISVQEKLIEMGVMGGKEYIQRFPDKSRALEMVVDNADKMKTLTTEEIERLWHGGEYLTDKGIDMAKLDHFGEMNSLMDAVIHPATTFILLTNYKKSGDSSLLPRVTGELVEVLEHIKHINNPKGVKLTSSD